MPRPASTRVDRIEERRRIEKGLAEMVGIARGIIADGRVSSDEAERLALWARENPDVAARWPANLLARRLEQVFRDGRVDARERKHLASLLGQLAENPSGLGFALATDLPFDHPPPEVTIEGSTFVFAGDFAYGPRRTCEREVEELGGECERAVTRRTDYLVIGRPSTGDWSQREFGSMINEVVRYRARGVPIAIVSEESWTAALP